MADVSFAPSSIQEPQNGGWVADAGSLNIYVTAGGDARSVPRGADPERPPDGRIDIGGYGVGGKGIVLHGTGAIKVTKAPVGSGLPLSVFHADIGFTSQSGTTGTLHLKDKTVTLDRSRAHQMHPVCLDREHLRPQPGRIISGANGFFSTQTLWPLTNQWQVGDCKEFVAVEAGADAAHPEDGMFGIYRREAGTGQPTLKTVTVHDAGALKITHGPVGEWARPTFGNLQFTSESGVSGTFHTTHDTFTLDRGPRG